MCECNNVLDLDFVKVRDVKSPEKGTPGSAGIDFFVPNDLDEVMLYKDDIINIPSGIHVKIPKGYALVAQNKSGIAINSYIKYTAGLIDEDYQGEIGLCLHNIGKIPRTITPGMKILQFILVPVPNVQLNEKQDLESLYQETTERGEGGYGSTGI